MHGRQCVFANPRHIPPGKGVMTACNADVPSLPATLARALHGIVVGRDTVLAPGPGHSPKDLSLSVKVNAAAADSFVVHSFSGDDWRTCRDHVRNALGLSKAPPRPPNKVSPRWAGPHDQLERTAFALGLWHAAIPLHDTLAMSYLVIHRGLAITQLADLSHVLRWHHQHGCLVALMTDPLTATPCGVHRTFLNKDGTKRDRKMLGRQGLVRLSREETVTQGLGLTEGIEDGLAVMISGWQPIWAATSAGAIEHFPVLIGIEPIDGVCGRRSGGSKSRCLLCGSLAQLQP